MGGRHLRERLRQGPLLGTFVKLPRREVLEVLALAGLDFIICDLEHSQMDEREARDLVWAGRAIGLPVVVRLAELERGPLNRLLEAGAAGLQVPRVRSRADVQRLRDLALYPPQGSRSTSLTQTAAGYGSTPIADYIQRANEDVLLVGQFETREMQGPAREVMEGLDVAFVGTTDLSVDFGTPGSLDHPQIRERLAELSDAARATGVALGIFVPTLEAAAQALTEGYRYVAVGADVSFLQSAARDAVCRLRERLA